MPRRRTGRRRGRPRQDRARHRETTRAGRRGQFAEIVPDRGTAELRLYRRMITGNEELPVDPLGVLLGRAVISNHQYSAGRDVAELIATVTAEFGGMVANAWVRIFAGPVAGGSGGLEFSGQAERALRVLDRLRHRLRSKELVHLVFFTAEGNWLPSVIAVAVGAVLSGVDQRELERLGLGLERVARSWSSGAGLSARAVG